MDALKRSIEDRGGKAAPKAVAAKKAVAEPAKKRAKKAARG
jgi:hypothetical protein